MDNLNQIDDMVCEYLLFRGFTKTFRSFGEDRENDRAQGFNVDKIVTRLFELLHKCDYKEFNDMWTFLNSRFFCLLDAGYVEAVDSFWNSLRKLYIVCSIKCGKLEEVTNFFSVYSPDVLFYAKDSADGDWRRWCSLPYLQHPEQDSYFMQFFASTWEDSIRASLTNFLHAIFQNLAPPSLLGLNVFKTERQRHNAEAKVYENEINGYKEEMKQNKKNYHEVLVLLKHIKEISNKIKADEVQREIQSVLRNTPVMRIIEEELEDNDVKEESALSEHYKQELEENASSVEITDHKTIGLYSDSIARCKWDRMHNHICIGGKEGLLSIYNYDGDNKEAYPFDSFDHFDHFVLW